MEIDWDQERPNKKQVAKLEKKMTKGNFFQSVELIDKEHITTFKKIININNRHGGIKFLSFKFKENKDLEWFLTRNREKEISFFETFFKSEEFKNMSGDFVIKEGQEKNIAAKGNGGALTFDGELAKCLTIGGAYRSLTDYRMAKSIGVGVYTDLFGSRYEDISVYKPDLPEDSEGYSDISNWFKYIDCWSFSYTVLDKGRRLIHVILITDED